MPVSKRYVLIIISTNNKGMSHKEFVVGEEPTPKTLHELMPELFSDEGFDLYAEEDHIALYIDRRTCKVHELEII